VKRRVSKSARIQSNPTNIRFNQPSTAKRSGKVTIKQRRRRPDRLRLLAREPSLRLRLSLRRPRRVAVGEDALPLGEYLHAR
jgi:hypothetical protein